jgi:transglutaminase-like putative cysteine protease
MRYRISHTTHYTYSQAVFLEHHVLRLRPRSDGMQTLHRFNIQIDPNPNLQTDLLDINGNTSLGLWFANQQTPYLLIKTLSEVETHRTNPFDYWVAPWALKLPVDYPTSIATALTPYLKSLWGHEIAPGVSHLAHTLLHEVDRSLSYFLTTLTQRIYDECAYTVREQGDPLPAGITWEEKKGTCRDFAVLFIEACRAVGLAARFVSGYQEGDPNQPTHDLHAWVEVYVPGGGWRGFDPTHGLAVTDRHVALAAAAHPRQAAPVTGHLREGTGASSTLTAQISVSAIAE